MKLFLQNAAIILIVFCMSCSDKNSKSDAESSSDDSGIFSSSENDDSAGESKETAAVCVLDKLSVRDAPSKSGKYLTNISLGETVTFLGQSAIDSTDQNKEYVQVRLLDGTSGWSLSSFIIPDSKTMVFVEDAEVYKRPDLLTKANKKYSAMDIVAVKQQEGDWMEVTGKRLEGKYIESGWVKNSNVSDKEEDIAVAKFAQAALAISNEDERVEAIRGIVDNSDLSGSVFISKLKTMLMEVETDVEEYDEPVMDDMDYSDEEEM